MRISATGGRMVQDFMDVSILALQEEHTEITLTMSNDGAVSCFESLLDFLYCGSLDTSKNDTNHVSQT